MTQEEYQRIYNKAISQGLDPLKNPVGAYLANNNTIWCIFFELSFAISLIAIMKENGALGVIGGILASVFGFLYFKSLIKLSEYMNAGLFSLIFISIIMSPFSFPTAIATKCGALKR